MTYQEVYLRDDLTIEAKAIYGMLCSYAGTGDTAYPSVDFMCDKLHIGKARFYKHMGLLVNAGVVERKAARKADGLFTSNTYFLAPNTQNRNTENRYAENRHSENRNAQGRETNNNTINKNNCQKNIISPDPKKPYAENRHTEKTPLDSKGTKRGARHTQPSRPANRFNNFQQRDYDYADLERRLAQASKKGKAEQDN